MINKIMIILECIGIFFAWWVGLLMTGVVLSSLQIQYSATLVSQIIMLLMVFGLKRITKVEFNDKGKVNAIFVAGAIFTGVGLAFFSVSSAVVAILTGYTGEVKTINLTMSFILLRLSAPVVEELFFRGIMMNLCRTRFKVGTAIFITALIFAIGHMSPIMFIHAFIGGLLSGYYYYYSGKIVIPIIIHFVNNFIWGCLIPVYTTLMGDNFNSSVEEYNSLTGGLIPAGVSVVAGIIIISVTAILVNKFVTCNEKVCNLDKNQSKNI